MASFGGMSTTPAVTAEAPETRGAPAASEASQTSGIVLERTGRRRVDRVDAVVATAYLAAALALLWGLWSDLDHSYLRWSLADQDQWEWYFAFVAHAVAHLQDPMFTTLQNYPQGVNTMANTLYLGLSVPLAPLTLIAGPTATGALVLTLGLAGTAAGWYWLFSRHLVTHRSAAALGGAFTGFCPAVISHANAHPNWVAGFAMPALVLVTLRIATAARPVRDGVVLGLLVVWQTFVGEELLLIGATAGFVVAVIWLWSHPEQTAVLWRPLAKGVAAAAAVALALLAVPLWWQFAGPQAYHGLPHPTVGTPLDAFTTFPSQSLAGNPDTAGKLSMNRTEENAFFGWPLVVLLVAIVVRWRRDVWIRTLGLGAFLVCLLSLGATVTVGSTDTGVPSPWALLAQVPLYDTLLNTRFTFGAIPMIAALLALATDRVCSATASGDPRRRLRIRALWAGALVAALLPILPVPLTVGYRPSAPAFFADGTWRSYVDPGGTVVSVPLADPLEVQPLQWQIASGFGWSMPGGYFVGPNTDGRTGMWGAPPTLTASLMSVVRKGGPVPFPDDRVRTQVRAELRAWHADVLVLVPGPRTAALRMLMDTLVGPRSRMVDGVLLWDVRDLSR